jgi:hypothetical protein
MTLRSPTLRLAALLIGSALAALAPTGAAQAADPQRIQSFKNWDAYTFGEGADKVCYMASRPTKSEGNYKQRGDVFLMITHRPAEKSFDVVSMVAGYTYPDKGEVTIQIGNQTFRMFANGDTAWSRDETDKPLATALRGGATAVVKGASSRGTRTTDVFSLAGATAAYQAITKACGG